jgi:hypothetical protein
MPSPAFASSATRVVTTPFGPVTVSMMSDWLCQDGSASFECSVIGLPP